MPSLKYIKSKEIPPTDWISKEKRELFCKSLNTLLMTDMKNLLGEHSIDSYLDSAKKIVDRAFENYPDTQPEEEVSEEEMPL